MYLSAGEHYHAKPLAAFKYLFWHKTILGLPGFPAGKLQLSDYPENVYELSRKALQAYKQLNVYEIWNSESLNSTLRQIEFYNDTAAFRNSEDLWKVYEAIEGFIFHLEKQAESGYQFYSSETRHNKLGKFHLYINEVMTGDNSILSVMGVLSFLFSPIRASILWLPVMWLFAKIFIAITKTLCKNLP